MQTVNFEIRRAGLADVDEIAAAHLDSIRSIGPRYYEADVVSDWVARVRVELYDHHTVHDGLNALDQESK